ncbi:MAG TPA: phosphoglycerate kinase [Caulobacteraceae bacterium]|jgi:phosphoglycerate kinase
MAWRSLDEAKLSGARALVRVDFNVPMSGGRVSDDTRLLAALPTIQRLRAGGAKVALLAHFERPKGKRVPELSLKPVAKRLAEVLGQPVTFVDDCVGEDVRKALEAAKPGDVLLLENVRFHAGEESNDAAFARDLAANADIYINDAFSAAHRAHASTEAVARLLPSYSGEAMARELEALQAALGDPKRPVMGIVGGSKVSTKLELLDNLVTRLDMLAIGGGMANTFLFADGVDVGGSLCEKEMADTARQIRARAAGAGCELLLPVDVVVAQEVKPGAAFQVRGLGEIGADEKILDAGPKTVQRLTAAMDRAKTLIWNGPLGVFEVPPFDAATNAAARHAAELAKAKKLIAVAGGGDTVAALNHAGVAGDLTFVSTAGGAFLEWMEGKTLPGVQALQH